jgi:putative ABC transport system ATP-binding protein
MTIFETRLLGKDYRSGTNLVQALIEVSIQIAHGSFTVFTGPSGSGKTTLLTLLGGLDRPTKGEVLFNDRKLAHYSDTELTRLRRRFGFVFQDFALISGLPVWENVTYPLIPQGIHPRERHHRAQELSELLGLANKMNQRSVELSGGEQQRVAIARALVGKPEVIIADEPTSNLDPETAEIVLSLFQKLHTEGITILVSSHDPRIKSLATHLFPLKSGRLQPDSDSVTK